jgi:DNA-binding CsgD family transcriptional regulator
VRVTTFDAVGLTRPVRKGAFALWCTVHDVPAVEPSPMIRIDDAPRDAVLGALELTPIFDSEGMIVDHLVTQALGIGTTLLFGNLSAARGHRLGELDARRSEFVEKLLNRLDGRTSAALDLRMLDRLMRILLTVSPAGVVSVLFARVDAPSEGVFTSDDAGSRVERLLKLLSVLSDGVAMYEPVRDAAGDIVDFICTEMSDADPVIPAGEQIGRRLLELYPETSDNGTFAAYCRVMQTGEPWVPDPFNYRRGNQSYLYRLRVVAVGDHLVVSWRDTLVDGDPLDAGHAGEPLTPRQIDILRAIAAGHTTADIAAATFLSPFTVRNEVRRILAKLHVRTRAEAVAVGISQRLVIPGGNDPN